MAREGEDDHMTAIYFALFSSFLILYKGSCILLFPKMEYHKIQILYTGHLLMRILPFNPSFKLTFLMDTNSFSNRSHFIVDDINIIT